MEPWVLAKTGRALGSPQGWSLLSSSKASSWLLLKMVSQNLLMDTHSMEAQGLKKNLETFLYGMMWYMKRGPLMVYL